MSVLAAGMSHIFDNITKDVLKCLDAFPRFQEQLRSLVDLLSVDHYRSRPVAGNRSVQDYMAMDGKMCNFQPPQAGSYMFCWQPL